MGLYLCIYRDDEEVEGVEVGSYADYGRLIDTVIRVVENGERGSRCPTLVLHSDCDGTWETEEVGRLQGELALISDAFRTLPPLSFESEWQRDVAGQLGVVPTNLYESFIDVDGEYLLERLADLVQVSREIELPIYFQ